MISGGDKTAKVAKAFDEYLATATDEDFIYLRNLIRKMNREKTVFSEKNIEQTSVKITIEICKELNWKMKGKMLAYKGLEKGREEGMKKGREEGIEEGLIKGREEGLEEGLKKGVIQTARNLKACNVDIETIKAATGLSSEEIERL